MLFRQINVKYICLSLKLNAGRPNKYSIIHRKIQKISVNASLDVLFFKQKEQRKVFNDVNKNIICNR